MQNKQSADFKDNWLRSSLQSRQWIFKSAVPKIRGSSSYIVSNSTPPAHALKDITRQALPVHRHSPSFQVRPGKVTIWIVGNLKHKYVKTESKWGAHARCRRSLTLFSHLPAAHRSTSAKGAKRSVFCYEGKMPFGFTKAESRSSCPHAATSFAAQKGYCFRRVFKNPPHGSF